MAKRHGKQAPDYICRSVRREQNPSTAIYLRRGENGKAKRQFKFKLWESLFLEQECRIREKKKGIYPRSELEC